MAKVNKEQQRHAEGMERALKIVKEHGVEALEKEVRYRSSNPLPCNVSPAELAAVARMRAKDELMFVATAMAVTLTEHIKMPPSIIMDYLQHFNDLVDVYRVDQERFQKDMAILNRNYVMNETIKAFLKEESNNDDE